MTDSASGAAAGRIFISYRRQDSAYPAGWLYDRLAERFGSDQVFKDVDSIELGDDFVETITNAVGSCDILLALIGQEWLDVAAEDGSRRLDDPDDFVRLEIEAALQRKVLLIPILVEGAVMPRGDQLPPSIAPLVRRQALELSPTRFRADTDHLLDVMERTLSELHDEPAAEGPADAPAPAPKASPPAETEPPAGESPFRMTRARIVTAAFSVLAIAALIWLLWPNGPDDKGGTNGDPTSAPTSTSTKPPKLGGADAPVVLAHRGGNEEFAWQTLPAFEAAARIGAGVEVDVRWTKDGVPVLLHDPTTTPGMDCTGGPHVAEKTNWPVLRDECRSPAAASEDGQRYGIPTFDQGVAAVAKVPGAEIYPEVKVPQTSRQVRQFVSILQSVKMIERAVVTSAKPGELAKIHAQAEKEGVDGLRLMQFVSGERVPVANLADNLWGVAVEVDVATEAYVKALQGADLKVMVWNINKVAQWEEAGRQGADIVMTDRPAAFGKWSEAG